MSNAVPSPEELLTELRFAQRIALHLVKDQHLADEVAQEAVMAALERSDVDDGPGKRAWLAGVVRNLVRNRGRDARRRHEREARYAQDAVDGAGPVAESAAEEAIQRGEQKARVAGAVMELPEPYRTVVVLRYMEELSPPEIAKELARPLDTVKTQLRRGLARLRENLDAQSGNDGQSWAVALLPLIAPRFPLGAGEAVAAASVGGGTGATVGAGSVGLWGITLLVGAAGAVIALVVLGFMPKTEATRTPKTVPMLTLGPSMPIAAPLKVESAGEPAPVSDMATSLAGEPRVSLEGGAAASPLLADEDDATGSEANEAQTAALRIVDAASGRPIAGVKVNYHVIGALDFGMAEDATDTDGDTDSAKASEGDTDPGDTASQGVTLAEPGAVSPTYMVSMGLEEVGQEALEAAQYEDSFGQSTTTDEDGAAQLDLGSVQQPFVFIELSHEGHATAEHMMDWTPELGQTTIELARPAPLTIERGDVDRSSVVVFVISDMVMNFQRAGMIDAGSSETLVADLAPGMYRVSGSAHRAEESRTDTTASSSSASDHSEATLAPSGGSAPYFTFHDQVVELGDGESPVLSVWDDSVTVLLARIAGSAAGGDDLRLRATGRYKSGSATIEVPFHDALASVPALAGPTLQLVVLRGKEALLETSVQVPEDPSAGPVELTLRLPDGALRVVTLDGADGIEDGAEDSAVEGEVRFALSRVDADSGRPFVRSGTTSTAELAEGIDLEHLPPGRFEFWWSSGRRIGMAPVEIGAGPSTLEIDASAPSSTAFTLRPCGCVWPLMGVKLLSGRGATIPFDIEGAWHAAAAESSSTSGLVEPFGVELLLPQGAYRVGFSSSELARLEEPFRVGPGSSSITFHATNDGSRVELRFAASEDAEVILVSRADVEASTGQHGHLLELDGAGTAVLYLAPGRYRAVAPDGRSAEFDVLSSESSVAIELR